MTSGISNLLGKTISTFTKPDALRPIIALEAVNVTGRTYQAHKRGGKEEARERIIEETSGSLVWLGCVKLFNKIGDFVIGKILDNGSGAKVDTGKDAARNPFVNFLNSSKTNPKHFSERALSLMKFGKVVVSILAANAIIGFIVPKFNHKLTNYLRNKGKENHQKNDSQNPNVPQTQNVSNVAGAVGSLATPEMGHFDKFKKHVLSPETGNISFKGRGLNVFTNFIENTNTGQLMSTDVGTITGRSINARKKQERVEIIARDGGSVYFYMFAQSHVRKGLNKIESGRWNRLDPISADIVHNHMIGMVGENQTLSVKEFRQKMFGEQPAETFADKFFGEKPVKTFREKLFGKDEQSINLNKFNSIESDPIIQKRAKAMSELQPKILDDSILTRQQVMDIYQEGEINNPKLLKNVFESYTEGASSNPNKFVSTKKLNSLKGRMAGYVEDVCKAAEKNGGLVDRKLLNKVKNKNMTLNGVNFVAGFVVAATFLSTLIPKFQYWLTRRTTGVNAFPGTYEYNQAQAQTNTKAPQPQVTNNKEAKKA